MTTMTVSAVETWPIEDELLNSPAVTNRNLLAAKFADAPADVILKQYVKMTAAEVQDFYGQIFDTVADLPIRGVGLELGAGVAPFSAVAARRFPAISAIYAVELVPDVVSLLQPKTLPPVAGDRAGVIRRIVGSFDRIMLPDASVDFCIEFASLHHSDDLERTLREVARVMKPGGLLIAVDRAHHDALTDEQVRFMLDLQYPAAWKRENGYSDDPLSRRMNGEHEIRLREWERAFAATGFAVTRHRELRTVSWPKLWRGALLRLPFALRRKLDLHPSRARWHRGEWLWQLRALLGNEPDDVFIRSTHDYSLFVAARNG